MGNYVKLINCLHPEEIISLLPQNRGVVVIIDSLVKALYGNMFPFPQIEFNANEQNKTLTQVSHLTEKLLELGTDRDSFILVVGGGITTDIGAFTGSVYFRGVRFGLVPTTLLSQVDAAIGGKNGVNHLGYKNILGIINQPEFTVLCPAFLKSLNNSDFLGGVAEMLKTLIIGDREKYFEAVKSLSENRDIDSLTPFIQRAAQIKASIVTRDMYESGERKLLNLGHTFAHAIEKESGTPHGLAVAAGIVIAAKLSAKLSLLNNSEAKQIEKDFKKLGLPTTSPVDIIKLADSIKRDKKKSGNTITFILIEKIGKCITHPVNIANLEEALYDLS